MQTQYREFEGPAITMGGGDWMTTIAAEKIENIGSTFVTQPPTHSPAPSTKIAPKKSER